MSSTAEELFEKAERVAGRQALDKILGNHASLIESIRNQFNLEADSDLLSGRIGASRNLPAEVSARVASLHDKIRVIIEEVAKRIQNRRYEEPEASIERAGFAQKERERADALVVADKQASISAETLRILIDFFHELNDSIIDRLRNTTTLTPAAERTLLLKNAVLVYELADFTIQFMERFQLDGVAAIERIRDDIRVRIDKVRVTQQQLKQRALAPDIDATQREQTIARATAREESLAVVESEWKRYLASIDELKQSTGMVKTLLPGLRLFRDEARSQIDFLELVAIMQILKSNIDLMQNAAVKLGSIKLATLSVDRVERLLGLRSGLTSNL